MTDHDERADTFFLIALFGALIICSCVLLKIYYPQMRDKARPQPTTQPLDPLIQSAENESSQAAYQLGTEYLNGINRKKNKDEAVRWLQKAASLNHADAQFDLALLFLSGEVVEQDTATAYYWVYRSKMNGHLLAAAKLSSIAEDLTEDDRKKQTQKAQSDNNKNQKSND
jgi:TPR repeat protein